MNECDRLLLMVQLFIEKKIEPQYTALRNLKQKFYAKVNKNILSSEIRTDDEFNKYIDVPHIKKHHIQRLTLK